MDEEDIDENFEYAGDCCVCGEMLDQSEAGNCGYCGNPFCWTKCGGWGPIGHRCDNCGGDVDSG